MINRFLKYSVLLLQVTPYTVVTRGTEAYLKVSFIKTYLESITTEESLYISALIGIDNYTVTELDLSVSVTYFSELKSIKICLKILTIIITFIEDLVKQKVRKKRINQNNRN